MSGAFVLYTDGASRGNPGPAAIGAVLYRIEDHHLAEVATISEAIGVCTNNVAEYRAVIAGLAMAAEHDPEELVLRSDSELLVRQLKGVYKVKAPGLKPLHLEARRLAGRLRHVRFEHVPRGENRVADALANAALDR